MTKNSDSSAKSRPPVAWHRRFPPRTVLAILGLLALCDLGFYLGIARPAAREEQERMARIDDLVAQVRASRRSIEAVQHAAERIETADVDGSALVEEIALPRRSAFSELLTELGAASEEAGVEIRESSYAVEPIEGSESYGILAVNANFRGQYDSLVRLLFRLDRSELFFIIGSLGATPRDEGNSNELQINMRFDTFVRDL